MARQGEKELRVFIKFVELCPYTIDFDSIKHRKPPEPDIFCKFRNENPIAFEMVECIDKSIIKSIKDDSELKRAFDSELEELPSEKKQRIKTNFSDADISISFCRDASINKRLRSIGKIFDYLLAVRKEKEGMFCLTKETFRRHVSQVDYSAARRNDSLEHKLSEGMKAQVGDYLIYLKPDKKLEKILEYVHIKRDNFNGLRFDIKPPPKWFSNPVVERIKTKFLDKTYKTEGRTELLCYYELQPELPKDRWLPEVKDFVNTNLKNSIFHRVWIYSVTRNKTIYVYPSITNHIG